METQSSTSASAGTDGAAPTVLADDDATDGMWCATYRLAVAVVGDSWFGTVHVNGLCEQTRP